MTRCVHKTYRLPYMENSHLQKKTHLDNTDNRDKIMNSDPQHVHSATHAKQKIIWRIYMPLLTIFSQIIFINHIKGTVCVKWWNQIAANSCKPCRTVILMVLHSLLICVDNITQFYQLYMSNLLNHYSLITKSVYNCSCVTFL